MDILKNIKNDINKLKSSRTNDYRKIAKSYKRELSILELSEIYRLCEMLLDTCNKAETIIAYQIIFDLKDKYDEDTFNVFEKWMKIYIKDWWDCDDLMTHAFQFVLMKYPINLKKVKVWFESDNFAVRRSASVILIRPAQKGLLDINFILDVCDLSMKDPHYLVQKGYGWLLKESYKEYSSDVINYLEKNYNEMSRTAFRYALEKMPIEQKKRLMKL